ncbi:hypothetical protein HMPREF1567_2385 [Providencia alcalifaciens PAL-2]|nr:hypothetical protein HMPREF1562_1826 [Providencia alcalifaciens F90-2004]EUC97194.1 hypothetical protein HMPREF1567_2385 [Providencia alcalifaciens PAL-2]
MIQPIPKEKLADSNTMLVSSHKNTHTQLKALLNNRHFFLWINRHYFTKQLSAFLI